ncbi:MAG: biotin/lipoyl-binding protein [Alphaproteobacteria bacterium]|nr:biotin/lipoyl-binding protein [Alphaproteobacteria bacterium]
MLKKFKITVDGKPYSVTVEDSVEDIGHLYPKEGGVMDTAPLAVPTPTAAPAPAAAPAPSAPKSSGGGAGDQLCPMGGVVVSVGVAIGQQVNERDPIAVVEAMKMHTTVSAQGSGVVKAIHVKPGDAVDAGQAIVTLG